jgi:hypothetical protein
MYFVRPALFLLIAALSFTGAAFLPQTGAQHRTSKHKTSARAPAEPTVTPTSTPTPVAIPLPTSEKANRRPQDEATNSNTNANTRAPATNNRQTQTPPPTNAVRYTYEFNQPTFYLHHIRIEHDATGHGQMTFERKNDEAPLTDPVTISPAALARITAAWNALNFLDSMENYQSERQMAHLGTIRLSMSAGTRTRTAEFNWTNNPQAATLMNEYRRVADQQLFVFEIEVARQYQPSDTVKQLNGLERLLTNGGLSDPLQLIPLLDDLANDERIPLIARNQAARLRKKISK